MGRFQQVPEAFESEKMTVPPFFCLRPPLPTPQLAKTLGPPATKA